MTTAQTPTTPDAGDGTATAPEGFVYLDTPGLPVLVPEAYDRWGPTQQRGYLAQRHINAAEARSVTYAYDCLREAGDTGPGETSDGRPDRRDPHDIAAAALRAAMALSRRAASRLIDTAVDFTERLPRCLALLTAGWIGLFAAHTIAEETRSVSDEHMPALDALIAGQLAPTRRRTHPPRIGPLRKMVTKAILRTDPVGAAARAKTATGGQDVTLTPVGDDLTEISALVTADTGAEIMDRIDALARTAGTDDPRSIGELRAAGLLALSRGWTSLPDPDGNLPGDPDAQPAVRRVLLHLYHHEGTTDLAGYGPVTDHTLARLLQTAETRVSDLADLADRASAAAGRYSPSDALRHFCQGRDGTCVFPGCQAEATHTDLDHIIPFDHDDPAAGGRTTSDDLGGLCRHDHNLKTEGIWVYWRNPDGSYTWVHGPNHPDPDPGVAITVEPTGPLAHLAAPRDPETSARQRRAAEEGETGSAPTRRRRPHRRDRRAEQRRRLRAEAHQLLHPDTEDPARPPTPEHDDPPPF